ncbi:MAG: hypothetical protein K1X79_07570 [Oligoflexia bacterium]|nr:hypothetical protein [Oligoflexia bacterium]
MSTRSALQKISLILVVAALLTLSAEWALRRGATHIVLRDLKTSGGSIEANPEFLIQYDGGKRRYVPNTHVIIRNHYLSGKDVNVDINALGLRDDEIAPQKPGAEQRIIVIGDSITAGDYLNVEEVYVRQLQRLLNSRQGYLTYRTINAGIGNVGLREEIDLLSEVIDPVKPDIVVVGFYLNDSRPPWGFAGEIGDYGWLRRHSLFAATTYRLMAQLQWISSQDVDRFAWIPALETLDWKNKITDFDRLADLAKYDWGAAWQESSWNVVKDELERLKRMQDRYSFKAYVAILPVTYQLETSFGERRPQDKMLELLKTEGFSAIDLLPALKGAPTQDLFFDHCHLNSRGNLVVAEKLAEAILASN